jgi:hypothetical protein
VGRQESRASRAVSPDAPAGEDVLPRFTCALKQVELVRGQLFVREPPGRRHGTIAAKLGCYLSDFVQRQATYCRASPCPVIHIFS